MKTAANNQIPIKVLWLLLITLACFLTVEKAAAQNQKSKTLNCNDPRGYSLVEVPDPDRAGPNSGTAPQILNIVIGGETMAAIKIPTDSDAQNFLLDAEKTREGFVITISYGVRYYFRKRFNFVCRRGNFYLNKIHVLSFHEDRKSMANPDRKVISINPNLPVEKFSIFDYLQN